MKKLLLLLATVGLLATACEAGGVDDGGNGTPKPSNKIATIEEQGANITATIATLQTTKSAVEATIASLNKQQPTTRGEDSNNGVKTMIAALEERVEALEQMIANLTGYTQGDLTEMQDWATATFATLEQYNALASELATLKTAIVEIEGVSTTELSEALSASEKSMKQWVNEQLSGYATIADVEAQIAVLTASLTEELKSEVEKVVATLTALMNDTKQEYEKAITEAIQNQGVINDKIAEDIANINKRIDEELATVNKRLDDIEMRLDEIEEQIKDLVDQIQSVSFIRDKGTYNNVFLNIGKDSSNGSFRFEIKPKTIVPELAKNWQNCVNIQANYEGGLDFIELPITSFNADEEQGIITIDVSCENLDIDFISGFKSASARLEINHKSSNLCSEYVTIFAEGWKVDCFTEKPAANEIYYTWYTVATCPTVPYTADAIDAKVVANYYDRKKGYCIMKFDKEITTIGERAFYSEYNLENIILPEGVVEIGKEAFHNCQHMVAAHIPSSVKSIGSSAFNFNTSAQRFKSLYITDIEAWFDIDFASTSSNPMYHNRTYDVSLYLNGEEATTITIPENTTRIKKYALYGFGGELVINNTMIETDFTVDSNGNGPQNKSTHWLYGSKFSKITIGENVSKIGASSLYKYKMENLIIGNNVTSIGDYAFYGCSAMTSVTIPDSVTKIGNYAFCGCRSLTSVTIPNSVTSIGAYAFEFCSSLTSVTIGDSVTDIGECAFRDCSSLNTFYGKSASSDNRCLIVNGVLNSFAIGCDATEYTIPDSVTSIGNFAFRGCNLISVTIPDSVTSIGDYAFVACNSLTSVTVGNSVTSIGKYAFSRFSGVIIINGTPFATNFTFKECVGRIIINGGIYGERVFSMSQFESITINNVDSSRAFRDCTSELVINCNIPKYLFSSIKSSKVTITDNVTSIGSYAFSGCSSLKEVYCKPTTPPTGATSMFNSNASGRKIYVPTASVDAYKAADGWSDYADSIVGYDF